MISLQVFYEGNVQGVGFRWTIRQIAKGFDVIGWVRNLPDGRVELQGGGVESEVFAFLDSVMESEVYGLLGPNGSGKSTTLKIILGLVSPTRGRTRIFGRDSSLVESREAVGFLPENPYFYKYLTGEETLRFFGKLCRVNGSRLKSRVRELLELVGLTNARDQRLSTYSKGMPR